MCERFREKRIRDIPGIILIHMNFATIKNGFKVRIYENIKHNHGIQTFHSDKVQCAHVLSTTTCGNFKKNFKDF